MSLSLNVSQHCTWIFSPLVILWQDLKNKINALSCEMDGLLQGFKSVWILACLSDKLLSIFDCLG